MDAEFISGLENNVIRETRWTIVRDLFPERGVVDRRPGVVIDGADGDHFLE